MGTTEFLSAVLCRTADKLQWQTWMLFLELGRWRFPHHLSTIPILQFDERPHASFTVRHKQDLSGQLRTPYEIYLLLEVPIRQFPGVIFDDSKSFYITIIYRP